MGMTKVNKL